MIDLKQIGYVSAVVGAFAIGNSVPYKFSEGIYEFFATPHYVAGQHQAHRSTLELAPDRVYKLDNKDCMYVDGSFVETKGLDIDGKKLTTGNLCFSIPQSQLEQKCRALAKEKTPAPAVPGSD